MKEFLPGLQKALDLAGNLHTLQDVADQIKAGKAQLWTSENACIVSEVLTYPRAKVLHYWLACGEKEAVIALSRDVLAWGKGIGCTAASLAGRRGWERALKDEGWAPQLVYMTRGV
ncbi:MAG: hypothetical protein AB7R40_23395 [Nitrospiraceae bacterium]